MDFTPLLKKCGLCKFDTCLIYKNKNNISCPVCMNDTINLNSFITNEKHRDKNYHYCQKCNVLFNYDENVIHHVLDNYGKIYYANLIKSCKIEGHELNQMPKFYCLEICVEMLNKDVIEIEWINFLKNDICCVCLDETSTFTECNHPLCKACRDRIENVQCPICRHEQIYKTVNYNYDYEEGYDDHEEYTDDNETYNEDDETYNDDNETYNKDENDDDESTDINSIIEEFDVDAFIDEHVILFPTEEQINQNSFG